MNTKGESYIEALQEYLAVVSEIPVRGNKALIKSVAEQIQNITGVNVPTQTLYKNPVCRDLINERCENQGIEGIVKRSVIQEDEEDAATQGLRKYLDGVSEIPTRNGKVNATKVAQDAGIKKSDLYRGTCHDLLNQFCSDNGLVGIELRDDQVKQVEDRQKMQLEIENNQLKQKNAALYAEVHDLRRQLKKYEKIEQMISQGKQVIL